MKDLKKLRQSRADKAKAGKTAVTALNALLDKAELTEAETAQLATLETQVDAIEVEVTALDAEITAEEKKAKRATLFGSTGIPARSIIVDDLNPATTGGFHNLAEFAVTVRNAVTGGGMDPRLGAAPANFHQNQGAVGEGFLVPTEYREQIWSLVFADDSLLSMCNPEPTSSNSIQIPKDETTPWGASGVQAYWRAEAGQMNASKIAMTGTTLQLHELYAFVIATSELLEDAPRLNNRLTTQAARAIRWQASEAVVWGDGNGKPLGFMKAPSLVTVSKEFRSVRLLRREELREDVCASAASGRFAGLARQCGHLAADHPSAVRQRAGMDAAEPADRRRARRRVAGPPGDVQRAHADLWHTR